MDDSEARLLETVEAATFGIMRISTESGRYEIVNEAFARMLGRSVAELMESDPYQVWLATTHPEDLSAEREALARLAAGEIDRYQLEKRMTARGSDEARWVRVDLLATRAPSGKLATITGYFIDVHEQRAAAAERARLEAQLRQAQKLDTVGKLAGGVAHDFNNRLLIIIGYTELLRAELPADSPLRAHADTVLASAQRGAELTRQLLAYSRRQVLQPCAFDLNASVEGMRALLERLIGERITLVTSPAATRAVFSDPGQIEQVILNLALNGRDAMPAGGELRLETANVSFAAGEHPTLAAGDYVALTVRDTGTGIPEDVVPHIFEPFFTTKEVGQGTGLGLSMVEGIVNQSGGAVRVETRVGAGTTVTIYLPHTADAPAPRYTAVETPERQLAAETVLVCDDDDDVRKLLVDVMRLRAYRILEARNGKHALTVAGAHQGPIHLLVTDVVMPELGGVELAAELRQRDPSLRVLYVSGYTDDAELLSLPVSPHTRFLAKPFVPGDLTHAVFSLLEGKP